MNARNVRAVLAYSTMLLLAAAFLKADGFFFGTTQSSHEKGPLIAALTETQRGDQL